MKGRVSERKNLVKLLILACIAVGGVAAVGGISQLYKGLTTSDRTFEIFNAAATLKPELVESVTWLPDDPDLSRQMDPLTRTDVTAAWLRAWEQFSIVAQTGDQSGLEEHFASSAYEGVAALAGNSVNLPVHQLAHTLRIEFFSQNGKVVGLSADKVQLIRSSEVGGVLGWSEATESYHAVLVLEDGVWRIQHWVRRSSDSRWWTDPAPKAEDRLRHGDPGSERPALNGVNYYPKDTPFDDFWPNYDAEVVGGDLDRIRDAGMNTVRIFIPFDEMGGRWTTKEDLAPVVDFMDLAEERDLGVQVTLFDGRTDHRPSKWDSDSVHLKTVVSTLMDHPALVLWDLKNEPDRDIGANGVNEQMLYAWISHVAHELRAVDPSTPSTVGWTTPHAALAAPIHTDVLSFHFYGPPDQLKELAPKLVAHADGRPVVLSEFGLPTWDSLFPGGHTEAHQARYLADILTISQQAGFQGTLVWSLWDLAQSPPDAGIMPWKTGPQKNLGLLRADGSAKPGLAVLDPTTDLASFPAAGPFDRLDLFFWRMVGGMVVAGLVVKVIGGRIIKRFAR